LGFPIIRQRTRVLEPVAEGGARSNDKTVAEVRQRAPGRLLVGQHNERRDKADRYNSCGEKQDLAQPKYRLRRFLAIHAHAHVSKNSDRAPVSSLVHLL
jgi:hypothetical protein